MVARKIELFAVQMHISVADYATPGAFVTKVSSLFDRMEGMRARDGRGRFRYPALAVFPEDVGTFLFACQYFRLIQRAATLEEAIRRIVWWRLPKVAWLRARHRASAMRAMFLLSARHSYELYHQTFSCLAHRHGMSVVAGSLLVPENLYGATATFRMSPARTGVYSLSVTFGPRGEVVHLARKVNIFKGFEDVLGLSSGPLDEQRPFEVYGTRVGNMISGDGFAVGRDPGFVPIGERLIDQGAEILVQPSATTSPWSATVHDTPDERAMPRSEIWFKNGLMALMRSRPEVRYGINPMLNGTFLDRKFEGQSTILGRDHEGKPTVLARASHFGGEAASEEILFQLATLPERSRLQRPDWQSCNAAVPSPA